MKGHVVLSHGSESGPEATKVSALAAVAEAAGWRVSRMDYRDLDARGELACIGPRTTRLKQKLRRGERSVLAGSSMGAFVSGMASLDVECAGLFLLALPLEISGHERAFDAARVPTMIVHGWNDELCPASEVVSYARRRRAMLVMLDDMHRLSDHVEFIAAQFGLFLQRVEQELDLSELPDIEE
ncbi:MAG: alpha/beta family hydrolase [Tahibacter sp.]